MKTTAAPGRFPYSWHRNMAQVVADETRAAKVRTDRNEYQVEWRRKQRA